MIFIEEKEVRSSDIGKKVIYIPKQANKNRTHKDCEEGTISSFNETTIWIKFNSPNGQKCNPNNLVWK